MKKQFILIYFSFFLLLKGQEINTFNLFPPESLEYNDFNFFGDELQGKQIVMLGEQTHMYGNIFEMKVRVVEYLHEELGFNTIAIESPMYDIWKMNQKGFSKKQFNESIWGVWSNSSEFQRLVNYIDKNNIKIIGFDNQVINSSQFIDDFFDFLEENAIELRLNEDDLGIVIEGILEYSTYDNSDIKFKIYENELEKILEQINKLESTDTNYHWLQFIKGLIACSLDTNNKSEIVTRDFGNKNDNIRDKQMADNLLSYIHRNPNEKIIVWADNIHVMIDNSSIKKPIAKDFIPMGYYIKNDKKDKVYSLATIHANDSIYDSATKAWYNTPIEKSSFEDELKNKNKPYMFISSNQEALHLTKRTRLLNIIDFTDARLDRLHDGYIFVSNATLPKNKIDYSKTQHLKPNNAETNNENSENRKTMISCQIFNFENNQSIPYANIDVRQEEIYRVADEDGFFQFEYSNTMNPETTLVFSSMGFESDTIKLQNIKDKVYLVPIFQQLDELVVTASISPESILKKAISKIGENHPIEPFNFYRYGKVLINKNDHTDLDLELITKDYDDGYLSQYVITQRVEQIKWNINTFKEKYKNSAQFFSYRQNAIRYANILDKRKYKKFKLNIVQSDNLDENKAYYIISFSTERNKWNYTNRGYPTIYSGKIYIDKNTYAVAKVIENWETTLNKDEIKKYFRFYNTDENLEKAKHMILKEENICTYSDVLNNGKLYASHYFNRVYKEILNNNNQMENLIFERDSYLYDFKITNVENIEYYEYNNKKENSLDRVSYNKEFWDSFYLILNNIYIK